MLLYAADIVDEVVVVVAHGAVELASESNAANDDRALLSAADDGDKFGGDEPYMLLPTLL